VGDQEASDEPGGAGDEVAHVLASCDRVARGRPLPANLPERRGGDNCRRLSLPPTLWERLQPRARARPLPLRRQGEVGRGWSRLGLTPRAPLPNPPLPSQGRELKLAAEAAPTSAWQVG